MWGWGKKGEMCYYEITEYSLKMSKSVVLKCKHHTLHVQELHQYTCCKSWKFLHLKLITTIYGTTFTTGLGTTIQIVAQLLQLGHYHLNCSTTFTTGSPPFVAYFFNNWVATILSTSFTRGSPQFIAPLLQLGHHNTWHLFYNWVRHNS